jgi:branched-chain amino acid transport system ATP-binding protein
MSEPVLIFEKVNAYYGRGRVLHDVSFEMGREPVAVIGRNGMGKTTLCLAVMGLMARADGSIRFEGQELMGRAPYKISGAGIGYVPQGRRLFPSLSTEEHLDILGAGGGGRWTKAAIWELFPRLAERRKIGAAQLSGGEQQMLAIGRILRTGARLLLLDEPTEGLAPVIVQQIGATIRRLKLEGFTILLVEQNFRFAATVADRHYMMEHGLIVDMIANAELDRHMDKLHGYLGV